MATSDPSFFVTKIKGASKVKEMLRRAELGAQLTLSRKGLQNLLLGRTKRRFDERQSSPTSVEQKDPSGRYWPDLAASTIKRHPNPNRMLYDTGRLKRSIYIVRSQMAPKQLQSPTGGGFRIGVRASEAKRAELINRGTALMPQRRFLGIGAPDVKSVDNWIDRNFAKAGIRLS